MDGIEVYVSATCHGQFLDEIGIELPVQFAEDDDAWVQDAVLQGINPNN